MTKSAGAAAINSIWRSFETRIKNEVSCQGVITHIPSHIQQTRKGNIRLKTDCDFAAAVDSKAAFFDAKTTAANKFYFSEHKTFDPKKIHQISFLENCCLKGSRAGLLVFFYEKGVIVWAEATLVTELYRKKEIGFDETTKGVKTQSSDVPIDIKNLIWG